MAITYNPLWKTLIDKGITKEELRKNINASSSTIAKMGKGDYVALAVIDRICTYLECDVSDVIQHVSETSEE